MGTPEPKIGLLGAYSEGYNMHQKNSPASPSLVFKMDRYLILLTGIADGTTDIQFGIAPMLDRLTKFFEFLYRKNGSRDFLVLFA